MKQMLKRIAALGLALLLAAAPSALASEAMGHEVHGGTVGLSQGTSLNTQIFWSDTYSDLRTERYITYTPNTNVTPTVAYGNKVLNRATLTSMAQTLEAQGKRVVSGINGDYYVMATGAPLGMVISDRILRSSSSYHWAVGFREDGSAFIGKPALNVTVTMNGNTYSIAGGVNKVRTETGGYVLLTSDFHANTQNTSPGVDVILSPVTENLGRSVNVNLDIKDGPDPTPIPSDAADPASPAPAAETAAPPYAPAVQDPAMTPPAATEPTQTPPTGTEPAQTPAPEAVPTPQADIQGTQVQSAQLTVGGRVTCTVDQVLESTGTVAIPDGKMVLTLNAKGDAFLLEQLRALQPGSVVDIDVFSEDTRWSESTEAIGALYKLVTNGAVEPNLDKERTARSALGIKADGSVVFYTMDGKQPGYSVGATLGQVAMRLVELGCVEAVCLDGGGSTTLGATYPDGNAMQVLGKPADGAQRANSTAIFLTTTLQPTGELDHYYLTPSDAMLLAGASVQMNAMAMDTSYYKMASPGQVAYSVQNGDGIITTEGVFTAGLESGTTQVMASFGAASGLATMTVVKQPDKITLSDEATGAAITALSLSPGQKVDLRAASVYKNQPLISQDVCYTWTADPGAGTVDANGILTAAEKSGSGNLTVSAGAASVTIPVNVAGHVLALETFESNLSAFTSTETITAALETNLDYVRYGKQSMRLEYNTALDGTASLVTSLSIPSGEKYLGLWVYGDGSGYNLTATAANAVGETNDIVLTTLDFTGWRHLSIALPEGTSAIRTLQIVSNTPEGAQPGTIWIDHLATSNEDMFDTTPPTVTITRSGTLLTAVVNDNVDRNLPAASVVVTYDGVAITSSWAPETGTLKATLPAQDGKPHRVTVTAVDASGNLGRASEDIPATGSYAEVFSDLDDNWAAPFANYLYYAGVTNGVVDANGINFLPTKNISRGEFFAMVARWMKLDLSQYEAVVLPFADTDAIPSWALAEVKAMYSLGIMKGTSQDGTLTANVNANISRAEAMTIVGRTQSRGFAENPIPFADAAEVPEWADLFVRVLVGQGAISGYENMLNPNQPITRGEVAKMLYTLL